MCGIAGYSLSPNVRINSKRIARAMLLEIEKRGRDATGFAYLDPTGEFQVHKSDLPAHVFVNRRLCVPKQARTVIMHTRFATQGDPRWNANNHPIPAGSVVGVHNGHVSNDDQLFAQMQHWVGRDVRVAQVDSEAAFALLGFIDQPITESLELIRGGAALAWLDRTDTLPNTLHLARLNSSPMCVATTKDGSLFFASTEETVLLGVKAAGLRVNDIMLLKEGVYLTVNHGEILSIEEFKPASYISSTYKKRGTATSAGYMYDYGEDWESWEGSVAGTTQPTIIGPAGQANAPKDDGGTSAPTIQPGETGTWIRDPNSPTGWSKMGDIHDKVAQAKLALTAGVAGTTENVSQLNARLAAEEPEVWDAESPESEQARYQEWLEANTVALNGGQVVSFPTGEVITLQDELDRLVEQASSALGDDSVEAERATERARIKAAETVEWCNKPVVSTGWFKVDHPAYIMDEDTYQSSTCHQVRTEAIKTWLLGMKGNNKAIEDACEILKVGVRPGVGVKCELDGRPVVGHLLEVPESFPSGHYTIRAFVPNVRRKHNVESVIIQKAYHEFEVIEAFDHRDLSQMSAECAEEVGVYV